MVTVKKTVTPTTGSATTTTTMSDSEYSLSYTNRVLTVTITGTADPTWTYTVTYPIVPSASAKAYYAANRSYPTTGNTTDTADADTGTYASQEGFFSNIKSTSPSATNTAGTYVKYTTTDSSTSNDTAHYEAYPMPVVHVTAVDMTLNKVGPDGTTALTGATFTLYYWNSASTETDKWTQLSTYSPTGTTTATVNVPGLVNGYRYKLVETTPPTGYVAAGDIFFKVANGAITLTDKDGAALDANAHPNETITPAVAATDTDAATPAVMTVTNFGSYEFPEAGGAGTVAFRIIGIAILAAAIYLLISKAKKNKDGGAPAPQTETGSEGEAPADPIAPTDADGQGTRGSEGGDGPTP